MIRERYAIWNNKGGVGKSTLTFHLASAYASQHRDQRVLVVDMCPQANCTMMLLGSGTAGEDRLIELENKDPAPTIAGYIDERLRAQVGLSSGGTGHWLLRVADHNENLPGNLYLIPGDGNLELLAAPISYFADARFPPNSWGAVHKWVRELTDQATAGDDTWTVFIDTNPSFAVYTELAMIAADKLIVPFNADDSSRHAVAALMRLLYGVGRANPVYDKFTFREQTNANALVAPLCHLFVGNRFTQYKGSATAFDALHTAVSNELFQTYTKSAQYFTLREAKIQSREDFEKEYTVQVGDFNTAGVVAAHLGVLLENLRDGTYNVHSRDVEVRKKRVENCVRDVTGVVARL